MECQEKKFVQFCAATRHINGYHDEDWSTNA